MTTMTHPRTILATDLIVTNAAVETVKHRLTVKVHAGEGEGAEGGEGLCLVISEGSQGMALSAYGGWRGEGGWLGKATTTTITVLNKKATTERTHEAQSQ